MKILKIVSHIFAILAAVFVLVAILVATNLSNVVAIAVLGIAFICSIVAAVTSLVYKLKIKSIARDNSTIGVIINTEKKGRE